MKNNDVKRRELIKSLGLACLTPAFMNFRFPENEDYVSIEDNYSVEKHVKPDKPMTCIVIGAGNRGWALSNYATNFPDQLRVIAIAEPVKIRQQIYQKRFSLDDAHIFNTWEEVFSRPKFADFVIISTIDRLHYAPAMKAMEMGYHVLLEKAVAQSWDQCQDILKQAEKFKRIVGICHVLRYSPYFIKMKDIVRSGEIGEVTSIQHLEPIEHIHYSHSFIRGNWRNEQESTPILLSKSCHDLDILYWILGKHCRRVTSFGTLNYFTKANAPEGSTPRCTGQCRVESSCPYSALKIFMREKLWGVSYLIDLQPYDEAKVLKALQEGPYGRCVFHCDNNVVDHQVVNMEFEGNVTVAFSMEAHTSYAGRRTRIMGTKGDMVGDEDTLKVFDFATRKSVTYKASELAAGFEGGGHGGGDWRLVRDFIQAVYQNDPSLLTSTIQDSMESHYIGFKAEESRKQGGKTLAI